MLWFNKKEKERRMNMISAIKPTSKASLKMQCLLIAKGDVKQAKELYDFYASDMPDLPDFDAIPPTWMQSAKDNALGFYQFIKDNKDDIAQGVDFLRQVFTKSAPTVEEVAEPLPQINE